MSMMEVATTRPVPDARGQLDHRVRLAARRGRLLALFAASLLCLAVLVGGLLCVLIMDAAVVLPGGVRLTMLCLFVAGALAGFLVLAWRNWLDRHLARAAGQRIDQAARASAQPVTIGLSLRLPLDRDALSMMLAHRAETRAAGVADSIKPGQAYPMRRLRRPAALLILVLGLWLLLAIIVPSQLLAMATRVVMPWRDAPPFSLTQLVPTWSPQSPITGSDVRLVVEPTGLAPESVDWVRLDESGEEIERFTLAYDERGGFETVLRRVESPITFHLEAYGRHSRAYTITPLPRPPVADENASATNDAKAPINDGSTSYDPDKVARRDLAAHRDWPAIKDKLQQLLLDLAQAQSLTQQIDPADAEALAAIADQLKGLSEVGRSLAAQLAAMQGELPPEAGELLAELRGALANMQSGSLPAPPSGDVEGDPVQNVQWLDQAADAAQSDQQRIGQGVGRSDLPTDSGTASGEPGQNPDMRDPGTSGTYDESNTSGDTGPLPEAVMQQVPPSYRDFVSAYFQRLAEEQTNP